MFNFSRKAAAYTKWPVSEPAFVSLRDSGRQADGSPYGERLPPRMLLQAGLLRARGIVTIEPTHACRCVADGKVCCNPSSVFSKCLSFLSRQIIYIMQITLYLVPISCPKHKTVIWCAALHYK